MAASVDPPRPDESGPVRVDTGQVDTGRSAAPRPGPLGPGWRSSSFSQGADSTCVEVAAYDRAIAVRDSKNPAGPVLRFSVAEWRAFLQGVRAGEFEPPGEDPSDGPHRSSANREASSS